MKISNTTTIIGKSILIVCAAMALNSCGVFSESKDKYVVNGSGVEVSIVKKAATEKLIAPPDKKGGESTTEKKSNKKVKRISATVSTEDIREDVNQVDVEKSQIKETPNTIAAATSAEVNSDINGEWTVYSVRGNIVTGEERPYICFDIASKKLYGSNGCNVVNGDLEVSGSSLKINNIATTMQMCADAPFEYLINLALSETTGYKLRQEGPDTYMDLTAKNGTVVMSLRRHNMEFLNGAWAITSLNGVDMPAEGSESAATIAIDIPQLKIHGTTGCNIFNGEIFIDPDKERSLQLLNIATTRMACPPNSRETELLIAFEKAESARQTSADNVEISSAKGGVLMTLKRINYTLD